MAYVVNKMEQKQFKVGDCAVTSRKVECFKGSFEKGTKVKVIGKSMYGNDLEDEHGNQISDTGFDSIE